MSGGRIVSELAQEGTYVSGLQWLSPGYGQMPMELVAGGVGKFWDDQTVPGNGSATYVQGNNGGVQLEKFSSGSTTGGFARLNTTLRVSGNFDIRVRYATGTWSPPSGSYLSMRVFDPSVPGSPYPNSLTIQRFSTTGPERVVCWDTEPTIHTVFDLPVGAPEITSGIFRMVRIGTSVSAGFWLYSSSQWWWLSTITRNTVPWRINLYVGADVAASNSSGTFSDLVLAGPAS